MSWQDDLRRLDADLAAGRIEPAAHRKQRDELLAQASGSTVPSPVPSPLRRPPSSWHSANPAVQPVDPRSVPPQRIDTPSTGPHPFQQHPPRPAPPWQRTESSSQKTMSHRSVPPVPDHLTTAPSPADITPTRYMKVEGSGLEPDQISRFPPLGRPVHHRPEEPDEAQGKHRESGGRRPTWLFLGLGVLVVLAMVVGLTAWVGSRDDSTPQGAPPQGIPSTASGVRPEPLEDRLPALPGEANRDNSTMSVTKARDFGLFPGPTADLFTANGAKEVLFRGSTDGDVSYLVLVVPTGSSTTAQTVVETLYQQGLASAGMRPVTSDVRTVSGRYEDKFLNTSWYGSGNNAVVIGVGLPYRGQSGMSGQLDTVLKQFESILPAG